MRVSPGADPTKAAEEAEALQEAFEERAAIAEFHGELPREEAVREAFRLLGEHRDG